MIPRGARLIFFTSEPPGTTWLHPSTGHRRTQGHRPGTGRTPAAPRDATTPQMASPSPSHRRQSGHRRTHGHRPGTGRTAAAPRATRHATPRHKWSHPALATQEIAASRSHAASPRPPARTSRTTRTRNRNRFPGWGHKRTHPPTSNFELFNPNFGQQISEMMETH